VGIVRFALKYPHTFYVVAVLILFLGATAAVEMPTDLFPEINIPVVSVIWQYYGLNTTEMEQRVTTYSEYTISTNVNGIKDMEAETVNGISVQKIYFQPDVNLDLAIAQIVAATNSIRALLPTGIEPPIVVQYSASAVPVLQVDLTSDTLSESQLYDWGYYKLRQMIAPIHGVTLPSPAGGKYRQIMVDIDQTKLLAKGLTPLQVVNAVNAQNLTLPGGWEKVGKTQYTVRTNSMPPTIEALNDIPVSYQNGATVFLRDIGHVRDGNLVQQNVVRSDGRRSVLTSVIKNGNASTLTVVNAVKHVLDVARAAAPSGLVIKSLFDQSVFVTSSVVSVLREGAIAAGLTAMMILLFLGSWRPTIVVMISIPLAMLTSLVVLYFLGEYDDPGWASARGRHSRRRFDGNDREHLSPARREEDAAVEGDIAWRRRNRDADTGLDTGDQLCLHLGDLSRRPGKIPVHAIGPRRRLRDARLLWPVADPDADHHRSIAEGSA
jgi:multidrug efflux pump subunit AcrB